MTQAQHQEATASDAGAKDAKKADSQRTVVLPPVVHQAPILLVMQGAEHGGAGHGDAEHGGAEHGGAEHGGAEHKPKTGFARQRERITETKTSSSGTTGAWSTGQGVKLAENPGASGVIGTTAVTAAQGEEKGVDVPNSGKEFFESWAGEKGEQELQKLDEEEDQKLGEDTTEHTADTGYFTESSETTSEVKEGEGASIGGFGADPEVRKAIEVLDFANNRRAGKPGSAKPTSTEVGTGTKGSASTSMETRKGKTRQSASAQANGLAGARAAAQTLAVADQQELTAAITALAQAGAFGDAGAQYDVKRGRAALEAHTKASGGVGVQARGRAVAHVDLNPLVPTLVLFFEAAAQAGVWGDVEAGLKGSYGKIIAAEAKIKASGFAGVAVEAKGAVFGNALEGIGASVQAAGKAGAEGKVVANQSIAIAGIGELEFEQGILAFAGAQARAKAKASISLTGVTLTAKASAFAGVKTSAWASVAGKLRGREVIKVGGTIGVSAGAGAEIGGTFSFQHGKLVIAGDLAAALKVGGHIGGTFELDLAALATSILELVADQYNKSEMKIGMSSPDYRREDVKDEKHGAALEKAAYQAVIDMFDDYAVEVMDKIHKGKLTGTQSLDLTKVQHIIQKAAIQGQLRSTNKETDLGIVRAASDAFGVISDGGGNKAHAVQGLLLEPIGVQALVVHSVNSASPAKAKGQAKEYAEAAAARKAKAALEQDLKAYSAKKMRDSSTAVHQYAVQEIVKKHWKEMSDAFPGGQASQSTADVLTGTLGTLLGDGATPIQINGTGRITQFPAIDTRITAGRESRKQAAQTAEEKKVLAVHDVLKSGIAGYKTQLIASADKKTKDDRVNKIIKKATSEIKSELKGPHADGVRQGIQDVVRQELAALTTDVTFGDGVTVTSVAWDTQALADARDGKTADVNAAKRQAALNKLGKAVRSRVAKGAKKGKGTAIDTKWAIIEKLHTELPKAVTVVTGIDGKTKTDNAIDAELTDLINEALGGLFTVTVVDGAVPVSGISSMADDAVFSEQHRLGHATLKGGEEQDNSRRRMVADALRKPFGSYSAEVRQAVRDTVDGSTKVKITGVEKARLQSIIDKNLKGAQADVANDVGDDALQDTAAQHFGIAGNDRSGPGPALLKKFRTEGLKIADFEAVPVSEAAGGRTSVAAEKKAQATLEQDLRKHVKGISGYVPSLTILNHMIDGSGVRTMANINPDVVVRFAIGAVWSRELEELDVTNGVVTKFQLRRMEVTARSGQ